MSKNFVSNSDAQALMQAIEAKKLTVSDTMPAASPDLIGTTRLYIGSDTASLQKGGAYQCQAIEVTPAGSENPQSEGWYVYNSVSQEYELTTDTSVVAGTTYYTIEWKNISRAEVDLSHYKKIWGGSTAAWELLSDAEKAEYDYTFFDDDENDVFAVVDAVTKGDKHPVTSNAVAEEVEDFDAEFSDVVNIYSAKNLIKNTLSSQTINGLTITVYSDGSFKVNGTSTGVVNINLVTNFKIKAGKYILTGVGKDAPAQVYITININGTEYATYSNYSVHPFTVDSDATVTKVYFYCGAGKEFSNYIFYPMLRRASIQDDAYVSYAMTNRELTEDVTNLNNITAPFDSNATISTLREALNTSNAKVTFNASSRYVIGHLEIINLVFDMSSADNGDVIFSGLGASFDTTYFRPTDANGINIFRDTNGNVIIQYAASGSVSIRGQLISILS